MLQKTVDELRELSGENEIPQLLALLSHRFSGKILFTTSFGLEDQVITHMIFSNDLPIEVATLDTGRLYKESYKVFSQTCDRYHKRIRVYFPDFGDIEKMVTEKGPYSFFESVENRKECCHLRKVKPLNRALDGMACWITGIRAAQSSNRQDLGIFEVDEQRQIIKCNPLVNWTFEQVKAYVETHNIPYNVLHDKGFVSIGCEPCTRAIQPGEDFRAGRWWWENNSRKECGLHNH